MADTGFIQLAPAETKPSRKRKREESPPPPEHETPPWIDPAKRRRGYSYAKTTSLRLHEEILDFARFMQPSQLEHMQRMSVVEQITYICTGLWEGCQVEVFGSLATGLSLPDSDIDLVVLKVPHCPGRRDCLKELAKALVKDDFADYLEVISGAKVPIVKLRHKETQISADICFNEMSGLKTRKLVQGYCQTYPALRPIMMVLKEFLRQRDLNIPFRGGMGSYLLTLCCVGALKSMDVASKGWDGTAKENLFNLGSCLMEVLELFGSKLNYYDVGVSVREGPCFFRKIAWGYTSGGERDVLCVDNPADTGHDVGKGTRFRTIQRAMEHGAQVLRTCDMGKAERKRGKKEPQRKKKRFSLVEKIVKNGSRLALILRTTPAMLEREGVWKRQRARSYSSSSVLSIGTAPSERGTPREKEGTAPAVVEEEEEEEKSPFLDIEPLPVPKPKPKPVVEHVAVVKFDEATLANDFGARMLANAGADLITKNSSWLQGDSSVTNLDAGSKIRVLLDSWRNTPTPASDSAKSVPGGEGTPREEICAVDPPPVVEEAQSAPPAQRKRAPFSEAVAVAEGQPDDPMAELERQFESSVAEGGEEKKKASSNGIASSTVVDLTMTSSSESEEEETNVIAGNAVINTLQDAVKQRPKAYPQGMIFQSFKSKQSGGPNKCRCSMARADGTAVTVLVTGLESAQVLKRKSAAVMLCGEVMPGKTVKM